MSQAKRPSNFNDGNTSKAPDNYQVKKADKKKFIESSKKTPSARRENTQIILESTPPVVDEEIVISTLPSNYRESFVQVEPIKEEKKGFTYKVPKGYENFVPVIQEAKAEDYVRELEVRLDDTGERTWEGIDKIMNGIAKKHGISPKKLHNEFKAKHNKIPDEWVKRNDPVVEEVFKTPIEALADKIDTNTPIYFGYR